MWNDPWKITIIVKHVKKILIRHSSGWVFMQSRWCLSCSFHNEIGPLSRTETFYYNPNSQHLLQVGFILVNYFLLQNLHLSSLTVIWTENNRFAQAWAIKKLLSQQTSRCTFYHIGYHVDSRLLFSFSVCAQDTCRPIDGNSGPSIPQGGLLNNCVDWSWQMMVNEDQIWYRHWKLLERCVWPRLDLWRLFERPIWCNHWETPIWFIISDLCNVLLEM